MAFVRVRDPETRHEFDHPEDGRLLRLGLVEHIKPKQYPPAARQRAPKHHHSLASQPVSRLPESPGEGVATEEEPENG